MYFSPIVNVNIVWSDFLATSKNNGSWRQTNYGEFGDITLLVADAHPADQPVCLLR